MNIQIDDSGFSFAGRKLTYYLYYYNEYPQYYAETPGEQFKKILLIWERVLRCSGSAHRVTYFPYSPDDQGTLCLRATENENKLSVEIVRVRADGYSLELDKLEQFITAPHEVFDDETEFVGEFDKGEVIAALLDARIVKDTTDNRVSLHF